MNALIDSTVPILPVREIAQTREFYERLGFRAGYADDDFLIMARDGAHLYFFRCNDPALAESTSCYVTTQDIDGLHARLVETSDLPIVQIGTPHKAAMSVPIDRPWGMREFAILDPCGNPLRVGQEIPTPAG